MLGSGVVQSRARLWDCIQIDGFDGAGGWKNSFGPGRLHRRAVCFGLLCRLDLLFIFATTEHFSTFMRGLMSDTVVPVQSRQCR